MNRRQGYLLASCMAVSAHAAETAFLDESKILTFTIADTGLTRITVQGDGVEDVYGHPTDITDSIQLHKSGHVFVTGEGLTTSAYLTLITQSGKTQDLKLVASKKAPAPIILKTKAKLPKVSEQEFKSWVLAFMREDVPSGFFSCGITEEKRIGAGFVALPKITFRNGTHRVTVFTVKPNTPDHSPIKLSPQPIARLNEAVFFSHEHLAPEKNTLMFVFKPLTTKEKTND